MNKCELINNRAKKLGDGYLLFVFFYLLCITSIFLVQYRPTLNFWYSLNYSFNNPLTNKLFFLLIIINTIKYNKEFKTDYYLLNRLGTYENKIKYDLVSIVYIAIISFFVFVIFNLSFSFLGSGNNYNMINYRYYDILIISYFIFNIIRYFLYTLIIASITYLLSTLTNKKVSINCIILLTFVILLPINEKAPIEHLYNMPIIFISYLETYKYSSLFLEVGCSIINLIIYGAITWVLYKYRIRKKEDV